MRPLNPLVLVVLGVSAATLGSACGSGSTGDAVVTEVPAGEIVFKRAADMYVMSPNGTHVRVLAKNASAPAVSPNGQQIAFVRRGAVWVMHRDGSAMRRVTKPKSEAWDVAWSADGKTIYFTTDVLLSIRRDGTHLRQLTKRSIYVDAGHPAPSPDGRIVVYTEMPTEPASAALTELHAVTPAGRRARLPFRIVDTSSADAASGARDAAWAPNGERLAYDVLGMWEWPGPPPADQGIYVSSSVVTPSRRIVGPRMSPVSPAWSSDGKWIAFSASPPKSSSSDLWIVRSDGTGLRQITKTNVDEEAPAWLPST
jgi:Tol biopolymer transport system component